MRKEDIDNMLISETHLTNKCNFNISGFVFHKTNHPDGKAHGGTGFLVRMRLFHFALNEYSKDYIPVKVVKLQEVPCIIHQDLQ